jgi:hypothetical protein
MMHGAVVGSMSVKAWYLVPLIVVISLVYGGTRHESLSEILAHSLRTVIWLIVFLSAIFVLVWLSGFGTASDVFSPRDVNLLLAAMAWVFGTMWIAGAVFQTNAISGLACLLSGGILALAIGLRSCNLLPKPKGESQVVKSGDESSAKGSPGHSAMWFPVILMVAALCWALFALWIGR